jgi:hypothetical protein
LAINQTIMARFALREDSGMVGNSCWVNKQLQLGGITWESGHRRQRLQETRIIAMLTAFPVYKKLMQLEVLA